MIELSFDHGPYPSEAMLDGVRAIQDADEARLFMLETLDEIRDLMPYMGITRIDRENDFDKPIAEITLTTGGWSGCEDLIEAMNSTVVIGMMWHSKWERGGRFTYEVPLRCTE